MSCIYPIVFQSQSSVQIGTEMLYCDWEMRFEKLPAASSLLPCLVNYEPIDQSAPIL